MKLNLLLIGLFSFILCKSQNNIHWVEISQDAYLYPSSITTYDDDLEPMHNIHSYKLVPVDVIAETQKNDFLYHSSKNMDCYRGALVKIIRNGKTEIVHAHDIWVQEERYNAGNIALLLLREYTRYSFELGCWNPYLLAIRDEDHDSLLRTTGEDFGYLWLENDDALVEEISNFYREGEDYIATINQSFQDGSGVYKLKITYKDGGWIAQTSEIIKLNEIDYDLKEKHEAFTHIEDEALRLHDLAYDDVNASQFKPRINAYIDYLKEQVYSHPELITYPFEKLSNADGLHIALSEDKNVKCYTWNWETVGSMQSYGGLYQTRIGEEVKTHEIEIEEGFPGYYVSKIYTIPNQGNPYYVVIANKITSHRDVVQIAKAFQMNENNDLEAVKIFKTKTKSYHEIPIHYNFYSAMDLHDERPIEVIKYDEFSKTFLFTLVKNDESVTDQFLQYQWNGNAFEYIGIK